jgi:hypothetical protein
MNVSPWNYCDGVYVIEASSRNICQGQVQSFSGRLAQEGNHSLRFDSRLASKTQQARKGSAKQHVGSG